MGQEKIFCGTGREKDSKYGKQITLSFSESDLQKLMDNLNEMGWVSAYLSKRKEPKGDQTHYLTVAVPKEKTEREHVSDEPPHAAKEPEEVPIDDVSDMPF